MLSELTKQEVKNYRDSLLNIHMFLEEHRNKLKDCENVYAHKTNELSSQINTIQSENVDLKKEVQKLSKNLESQRNDLREIETYNIQEDSRNVNFQNWVKSEFKHQSNCINQIEGNFNDNAFIMNRDNKEILQELANVYRKSKCDNDKLKEEMLSLPSEAQKVKDDLLKKIADSSIDNKGLIKEVQVVKKKSFIQEKMNEYFRTQIDRIKKRFG
jgi:alanyl-tRNA synthetase